MRRRHLITVGLAFPALLGAGTCGILFDLWSWDEINDHAERLHVDVTEGAIEIVAYPRTNIWIQRHVYAFERTLEDVDYFVDDDDAAQVVFHCDGRAVCFADHWLEIPSGTPIDVDVGRGKLSLTAIDAPTTIALGEGPITGDALTAPSLEVDGGTHSEITLEWVTVPSLASIDVVSADVAIALPSGSYACDISTPGEVTIDPAIVCEDGVEASLVVTLDRGDVAVRSTD